MLIRAPNRFGSLINWSFHETREGLVSEYANYLGNRKISRGSLGFLLRWNIKWNGVVEGEISAL